MSCNYVFFPESLKNFVYDSNYADDDITWLVVEAHDWEEGIISGPIFSDFSVVQQYLNENPGINFIITEV